MPKAPSSKQKAAGTVISLKVTLRGSKPPIWRRILVSGTMTLGGLHRAIQLAMGWTDSHLHVFSVDGRQFTTSPLMEDAADGERMTLGRIVKSGVVSFSYTYDFGDDWEHLVVVEKAPPATDCLVLPACVAGRRGCPPEDCGGVWGYADLLDILADPTHPERAERIEWLGGELGPDAFDIAAANAALSAAFAPARGGRGVWQKA